eukprot:TRINITY_DN12584_c1_g1_i2.p2 TRINITY_DN12584_c1_g1~~TRINITY_DN12584_c1_g1_i2.p2  ORF type:complete len:408 (+),score=77.76 TRINITY_DN12584_c1_g1_i2:88-1311(+)
MWKIALLCALYFIQGLPFGFQTKTLPVYLRQNGLSLSSISFLGLLSLPWAIKLLWAPFVDSYYVKAIGRRRTWILTATGALTIFALLASAVEGNMTMVLGCLFAMNLAASIQDVAVDALAIELLNDEETGFGNSAQVIGFKLGMLASGGVLTAMAADGDTVYWSMLFMYMAGLCAAVWGCMLMVAEPTSTDASASGSSSNAEAMPSWQSVINLLLTKLQEPEIRRLLVFLATYKVGEVMADGMFKPFLVDAGYTAPQIGLWSGSIGMACSIVGSLVGGWMASNLSIRQTLQLCLLARVLPQFGRFMLTIGPHSPQLIVSIMAVEAVTGGALTTAVFTMMMLECQDSIGASEYTMLSTVEVVGKSLASVLAGLLANLLGFPLFYLLATALCGASLLLIPIDKPIKKQS